MMYFQQILRIASPNLPHKTVLLTITEQDGEAGMENRHNASLTAIVFPSP
jgi:hypothetical protein